MSADVGGGGVAVGGGGLITAGAGDSGILGVGVKKISCEETQTRCR